MESIRKLSSFSFQWTKTLCQNNLNINYCILFYIFFSRATCIDIILVNCNNTMQRLFLMGARENKCQFSQEL